VSIHIVGRALGLRRPPRPPSSLRKGSIPGTEAGPRAKGLPLGLPHYLFRLVNESKQSSLERTS
jgi:hypothetical protein